MRPKDAIDRGGINVAEAIRDAAVKQREESRSEPAEGNAACQAVEANTNLREDLRVATEAKMHE